MEEQRNEPVRPINPRRRKRSKMQIFKEVYLPVVIAGTALLLVLAFIIGSIVRSVQKNKVETEASIAASSSIAAEAKRLSAEADALAAEAAPLAAGYDYDGAIAVLERFSGNLSDYPTLYNAKQNYLQAKDALVEWNDPSQITNLSFQLLIADPSRAFSHRTYASSFRNNFITTSEFSGILQQLYENGYILVRLDDFITSEKNEQGASVYRFSPLLLPKGKKPLVLTQTNVNYNLYLVDSDGDMLPDKNGGGFASRLILDENGKVICEMVDSAGKTVTGDYDLVPILDKFVESHPDFSYRGAKAVLALTGYNGIFGYRTNPKAVQKFGQEASEKAVEDARAVADALRSSGYTLACYTYENIPYGTSSLTQIQADLSAWKEEVVPVIGETDILVYAQMKDITEEATYSGEKYETLLKNGFTKFLGFAKDGTSWTTVEADYVRQGRLLVSGENLSKHSNWFAQLFDASLIRDSARN